MSLNNVLPAWVFELDSILTKVETCKPEERSKIYKEAYSELLRSNGIPGHIRKTWMEKIRYGIVWNLPRRMS